MCEEGDWLTENRTKTLNSRKCPRLKTVEKTRDKDA